MRRGWRCSCGEVATHHRIISGVGVHCCDNCIDKLEQSRLDRQHSTSMGDNRIANHLSKLGYTRGYKPVGKGL